MPKRTIEINDTLQETIDSACADLRERFEAFCKENPNTDPRVRRRRSAYEPHDDISEIADSQTPVYTAELDGLWYLYSKRFEQAYDDAGLYGPNEKPENYHAVAICLYLEAQLWEEYERLKDELGDLYDEREREQAEKDAEDANGNKT